MARPIGSATQPAGHVSARRLRGGVATVLVGLLAGALSLVLFGWLVSVVAARQTDALDTFVFSLLQQTGAPWLWGIATGLSLLGSEALTVLVVLCALVLARHRHWSAILALIVLVIGAQLLNGVLKETFQRARPTSFVPQSIPSQVFSFPSGHAMVSASFYLFVGRAGWLVLSRGWRRTTWLVSMLLLVVLIGWSRLYLGVHYFTDVVAGYVAGFVWADAVLMSSRLLGLVRTRRTRRTARTARSDEPPRVC